MESPECKSTHINKNGLKKRKQNHICVRVTPSAASVDSQVKTTEVAQEVGYDGGKLVKGHKRHILVDTLGLLLQVVVSAANVAERTGAILLLEKIKDKLPRLSKIYSLLLDLVWHLQPCHRLSNVSSYTTSC